MGIKKPFAIFGHYFLNKAKSPLYAGIMTFLIIFAGGFGSLFTTEIRAAFPFTWGPYEGLSIHASVFWILVAIASLTFFLRQWAIDDASREARNVLIRQIQTLPPADFLAYFAKVYDACDEAFRSVKALNDPDDLKKATRFILRGITTLAQRFDPRGEDQIYAANIMVFRQSTILDQNSADEIASRLTFCEKECTLNNFYGVLDLRIDLSTTIDNEDHEPDGSLLEFALPVPYEHSVTIDGRKVWRILPGAPFAFAERQLDIYADTSELFQWCNEKGDFTNYVREKIKQYFSGSHAEKIKSFISLPLILNDGDVPIGVLNIHRNKPGLLSEHSSATNFALVIRPFETMLIALVTRILEKERIP